MLFNFTKMIQRFGIPLDVQIDSGNDNGHYEAGEWVPNSDLSTKRVHEPLIPTNLGVNAGINTQTQGGQVVIYDMYWYSEQPNIPMGTTVVDTTSGRKYKVASVSSYTNYSTITIYGMKRVEK